MSNCFLVWVGGLMLSACAVSAVAAPAGVPVAASTGVAGQKFLYCHNPVWKPFDYRDQGIHQGIFQDYLNLLSQRMGITVNAYPTSSWTGALEALQRGECDFLAGAVKTPEREKFMRFTTSYYNVDYVLVAKQDKPFTGSLASLSGQTISSAKSGALLGYIERDYPQIKMLPLETAEQQVEALQSDKVYAGLLPIDELVYEHNVALNNFKVIHKLNYPYPISVAVRRDLPQLHAAFEAAVQSLTEEDRLQITRRWTPLTITQKVDYTQMLKALAVAAVVLLSFLAWNRRLQTEVRKRREVEAELMQRGQELEQLNRRLQISLQAGRLGTWEWFSDGRITLPDDAWLAPLGYTQSEMPSTYDGFLTLVHPDDVTKTRRALSDYIEGRTDFFEAEFRLRAKNGAWRWLQTGGMAMSHDSNGQVMQMAGVQFDVTARRQAQEAKQAFVSMVSHELRTPVNAVIGLSQRLGRTPLAMQQRDYLQKIDKAAELLLRVINDILDFSRLEAGKLELLPAPFALDEVLTRVMNIVRMATEAKDLQLRLEVAPGVPPYLVGDALRLEQVLINLAGNAAKFTERGLVRIAVSSRNLSDERVELEFSVTDTGNGMTSEQLQRLFKAFTQLAPFLTRRHSGAGLGLAISQQLVALMQGRIWAESAIGQGSCFRFCVPLQIDPQAGASLRHGAPAAQYEVPAGLQGKTVLLVEDNEFNQQLVAEMLIDANMHVEIASNGLEAVKKVGIQGPDVVLMDIQMDVMDGLEASQLIRSMPQSQDLPIIAMTAHGMPEMRAQIQSTGLNDFLLKPVEPAKLYGALLRVLEKGVQKVTAQPNTPSGSDADLPGLDMDRALRMTRGRHDLLALRLQQFMEDLGDSGTRMQTLANGERWPESERLAHDLKGAAGNIGAMALSALADAYLQTHDRDSRHRLIERMLDELGTLRDSAQLARTGSLTA